MQLLEQFLQKRKLLVRYPSFFAQEPVSQLALRKSSKGFSCPFLATRP